MYFYLHSSVQLRLVVMTGVLKCVCVPVQRAPQLEELASLLTLALNPPNRSGAGSRNYLCQPPTVDPFLPILMEMCVEVSISYMYMCSVCIASVWSYKCMEYMLRVCFLLGSTTYKTVVYMECDRSITPESNKPYLQKVQFFIQCTFTHVHVHVKFEFTSSSGL